MAKVKAKVTTKIKKKFWFPIVSPKLFNNQQLGEIYLDEIQQAIGRMMWHPLKEITENMRDQSVYLKFLIKNASGSTLNTELIGYKLVPSSLKRMVRRKNDRSDDSFVVETSDKKKIRIKTIILTAHNTKNSISTKLKKAMIEKMTDEVKKINFGNLIDKLIANKIQMEMKKFLTKFYPVKIFAVKYMGLEKGKGYSKEQEDVVSEEIEEAVEAQRSEATERDKLAGTPEEEAEKEEIKEEIEEAIEEVTEAMPEEVEAEEAAEELVEEPEE